MNKVESGLSILGFGCMRLPVTKDGNIDENQATDMLRYAIDHGVNYVDTAYPYHNGESEPFVGRALQGEYRKRVNLATKLPSWLIKSRADMDCYLDEQLKRLQTDHIDFYLVHGLMKPFWENLSTLGVTDFLDSAIADGRIKYAGFSFHDELALFKEIVDAYDWTFCQIQYNFMDEQHQAGTEGLRYAADHGLGIVIMEPLRGGMLTRDIPSINNIWKKAPVRRSLPEWALRWVWNHPEVTVVLSGMSSFEQVKQNVGYAKSGLPNSLSQEELSLFKEVEVEYNKRIKIPCTGCRYCMPCPSNVSIPECFEMYNQGCMFEAPDAASLQYDFALSGFLTGSPGFASQCQECGECEEKCPQGIPIREYLKKVAAYFGK
ncbi:MAG: aldo/keto reductase [Candidatus Methanoperedens sp.]|nr:aldo/keto reductase [Candidatus Methanoperedens sp.]CAG0954382.1 NADH-specific methylglyoxal reductase [Methanosarcinales archaeon]